MKKDPAVLLYINDWLVSTADMDADCRGWFLNLLLHNYDKGALPNDIEKLAVLCNVRFSEFNRFEQVFEQVLKHKFNKDENGKLTNERTSSILKSREAFKEKRSDSGKMSYLMRFFSKKFPKEFKEHNLKEFIKKSFDFELVDLKNEQMLEQVFKQMFELYRNENENENKDLNKNKDFEKEGMGEKTLSTNKIRNSEFFIKTSEFFSQTTEILEMRMFGDFKRIENDGKLDHFTKQTEAYIEYKQKTKEVAHRWQNYLSEWESEDWIDKLKKKQLKSSPEKKCFEKVESEKKKSAL